MLVMEWSEMQGIKAVFTMLCSRVSSSQSYSATWKLEEVEALA